MYLKIADFYCAPAEHILEVDHDLDKPTQRKHADFYISKGQTTVIGGNHSCHAHRRVVQLNPAYRPQRRWARVFNLMPDDIVCVCFVFVNLASALPRCSPLLSPVARCLSCFR